MSEILVARNVGDLAVAGSDMVAPLMEMQGNLALIGMPNMREVVEIAMQLHNLGLFSEPPTESTVDKQVNLILNSDDKVSLWELHRQLQACAVVALGLWEHENFKVPAPQKYNSGSLKADDSIEEEYMVIQRSASKETYLNLFLTYIAQAKAVRTAYSK